MKVNLLQSSEGTVPPGLSGVPLLDPHGIALVLTIN